MALSQNGRSEKMREQIIERVLENKIIAIVRGVYGEDCLNLAKALCEGLMKRGVKIVSGGTDNHLMLVDLIFYLHQQLSVGMPDT